MENETIFKLCEYTNRTKNKAHPIYCVKFCPYSDENIFAAAILNRIEIHRIIDDKGKTALLKTFEADNDEYFFAMDWTLHDNEPVLVAGGMTGKLYNIFKSSIFGIHATKNAINDIVFHPSKEYCAVANEDGLIRFYNHQTEKCIGIFENQREGLPRQLITVCFDPTGSYLAFGGMTYEVFIANLKDNHAFQRNLEKSKSTDEEIIPEKFNFLHNMCVLQNVHDNIVDTIHWYAENSFITKAASGNIIFWYIEGIKDQEVPFSTNKGLTVVKQHTIFVDNCNLWFTRFSVDPSLKYLTVGNCMGVVCLYDMLPTSFEEWRCHFLSNNFSNTNIRQCAFSHNGKFLVCCTDDGYLVTYGKTENAIDDEGAEKIQPKNFIKKKKKKTKRHY